MQICLNADILSPFYSKFVSQAINAHSVPQYQKKEKILKFFTKP